MIRSGIYSLDQLNKADFIDFFGKEKNISIYLYRNLDQIVSFDKRNQYAELILNRFNSDRNVIKRTYKNRFNKFDDLSLTKILEQNYNKISILDVAISDGRASCYFLEQSINKLKNFHYTGSDIQINYYLNKEHKTSKSYTITDENTKIVEITKPPFVWNLARTEGRFYFINNLLKQHFLRKAEKELFMKKLKYQERIELLHPDFKAILNKSNYFRILNYNLFDKIPGKFNVIRAMNILHQGYFNKDQLIFILNNLYNGLDINGLLIEGSNEHANSPVEGDIYKKDEKGFILISEPERPSRIKEFVLAFRHNGLYGE
jgi:hypothetical protein